VIEQGLEYQRGRDDRNDMRDKNIIHKIVGYPMCIRFEIAWAQKWAQSPLFGGFIAAPSCSKLLILFGGRGRNRTFNLSVKSRMLSRPTFFQRAVQEPKPSFQSANSHTAHPVGI
jgi:hypothetical protein